MERGGVDVENRFGKGSKFDRPTELKEGLSNNISVLLRKFEKLRLSKKEAGLY